MKSQSKPKFTYIYIYMHFSWKISDNLEHDTSHVLCIWYIIIDDGIGNDDQCGGSCDGDVEGWWSWCTIMHVDDNVTMLLIMMRRNYVQCEANREN